MDRDKVVRRSRAFLPPIRRKNRVMWGMFQGHVGGASFGDVGILQREVELQDHQLKIRRAVVSHPGAFGFVICGG